MRCSGAGRKRRWARAGRLNEWVPIHEGDGAVTTIELEYVSRSGRWRSSTNLHHSYGISSHACRFSVLYPLPATVSLLSSSALMYTATDYGAQLPPSRNTRTRLAPTRAFCG
ncbi:hypothetical protein FIBSPDRAFT_432851 [Athelia psychrophila]|uniref:Uncharacterized protein n=1 Tax=Athelia psychrophila TaxID=1759441 RepID=A0A167UIG6_9AGAM|nr:hypothetical protein FIBSPDRAFT_432851 [Fibularhizoctonia sp. CBS 109695]